MPENEPTPREKWPDFLNNECTIAYKPIDSEFFMAVVALTFQRGRIVVGLHNDPAGYLDGW